MMDPVDFVRILNVGLAVVCIIAMWGLFRWWLSKPRHERFLLLSLLFMVVVTGYGSLEALLADAPPGARVILYTPALLYCLYGTMSAYRKYKRVIRLTKETEKHERNNA